MRQAIPDLTLRTSFIVGFPGETEDDFQQLCDFVTAAQFDWLGVFAYSDEEGSPAFLLYGKVPPKEIERRRRKLMQLQKRISRKRRKQWIGREIEVMLEGPSEETDLLWEARTPAHAPEIDGKVFINDFGEHTISAGRQLPSRHRGRSPRLRSGRTDCCKLGDSFGATPGPFWPVNVRLNL